MSAALATGRVLDLTVRRAGIEDGDRVLELGCGWGSLTLWIAERFPGCRVTAVSNSSSQRRFIRERCRDRGLDNVDVITEDVNRLELERTFDRVVSVEMLEHVRNHPALFERTARAWLANLDHHRDVARRVLAEGGRDDPDRWLQRWRIFYLSVAELFGFRGGREWMICHTLYEKPDRAES